MRWLVVPDSDWCNSVAARHIISIPLRLMTNPMIGGLLGRIMPDPSAESVTWMMGSMSEGHHQPISKACRCLCGSRFRPHRRRRISKCIERDHPRTDRIPTRLPLDTVRCASCFRSLISRPRPSLPQLRLGVLISVSCLVVASCANTAGRESVSETSTQSVILAVGDSFFEYNAIQEASIPDVLGEAIGIRVANAAKSGALFANPDVDAAADGLDVRSQYREGEWEWVVVTGGGNDLNDLCGCGECDPVLDALIAADGLSGDIPDFVKSIAADGTKMMLVGYYDVRSDADYGFDRCADEFAELNARLEVTARITDGVWFVSAADVVSADQDSAYANDRVHPSIDGSRLIGEHLAAAMQRIANE